MPDAGAEGTSGAVFGSWRTGKGVCFCCRALVFCWLFVVLFERTAPLRLREDRLGLLAIAEVERRAVGLREESLSRLSALVDADSAPFESSSLPPLAGREGGGGLGVEEMKDLEGLWWTWEADCDL